MKPFKSFYRQICFLAIWSVCLQRWGWDWFVTHPKVNTDKTDKFITLHAEQRWSCFEIDEWWYSTSSSRNMCGNMGAVISGTKTFYSSHIFLSPSNTDIYWEVHSVIENKIISFPAPFFLLLFHCHSKGRWTCVAYLVWSPLVSLAMPWNNSSPFPLPRGRLVCCQLLGEKRKIDTNPHLTGKCSFIGADCRPNKDHRHHVHIP